MKGSENVYFKAECDMLLQRIKALSGNKKVFIIAVDGSCASGKTTLAKELSQVLDCDVIHTDDFYLQPLQRTAERYAEPGGNLDRERLMKEVLLPLSQGRRTVYRPFLCRTMDFGEEISLTDKGIYIVEGSYSCHPELKHFYDMTAFVTTDADTQKRRILARNGEQRLKDFCEKWIPLEEKYFAAFAVEEKADLVIRT